MRTERFAEGGRVFARRVGNTYYTREFGELVFRECILHEGRVRPMAARIITRQESVGGKNP